MIEVKVFVAVRIAAAVVLLVLHKSPFGACHGAPAAAAGDAAASAATSAAAHGPCTA